MVAAGPVQPRQTRMNSSGGTAPPLKTPMLLISSTMLMFATCTTVRAMPMMIDQTTTPSLDTRISRGPNAYADMTKVSLLLILLPACH